MIIFLALFSLGSVTCSASLQQAVEASVDGCIIIMRGGTWNENVAIDNDLMIIGGYGGGQTTIDGTGAGSVFKIDYSDVVLTGLAITGGNAARGGGINNDHGTVTLSDSTITGNTAGTSGGGIYNNGGTVTLNGASSISGNNALPSEYSGYGGGIYNDHGTVTLNDLSPISGNWARYDGGGIENNCGTVVLNDASSISRNTALYGCGGVINNVQGIVMLNDASSITGNTATSGGGVFNNGGNLNIPGPRENYVYGNSDPQIVG